MEAACGLAMDSWPPSSWEGGRGGGEVEVAAYGEEWGGGQGLQLEQGEGGGDEAAVEAMVHRVEAFLPQAPRHRIVQVRVLHSCQSVLVSRVRWAYIWLVQELRRTRNVAATVNNLLDCL